MPGTIMAGALSFHIDVTGRGGHAAMPHLNVDPIVAAAGIISALQVSMALLVRVKPHVAKIRQRRDKETPMLLQHTAR
jgi:metal-dependent amidase/aminoacylase/carboxypeptidase family protein